MSPLLTPAFFARDALVVARDLLGAVLRRDRVVLRITETEAYRWPDDTANHCHNGRTPRNEPMWGPPGRAYVYLCYGIHNMLNVVTGADGEAQAVLIRACEPVAGLEEIERRRGGATGPASLAGPGKIGQALDLDTGWSHHPLDRPGGLFIRAGDPPASIATGRRIGIDYAEPEHRCLPWRFADAESAWVTHRRALRPEGR